MHIRLLAATLLAALAWACASSPKTGSSRGAEAPRSTDSGEAPRDWSVPAEEAKRANPLQPTPDNVEAGQRLFARHCTACHGSQGHGDGPVAALWPRMPKDLTNPARQGRLTDGEIFYKISQGHQEGAEVIMPGLKDKLTETERWRIVLYVRRLPGMEAR
jgi:mono/diheme cytochrome c family protein